MYTEVSIALHYVNNKYYVRNINRLIYKKDDNTTHNKSNLYMYTDGVVNYMDYNRVCILLDIIDKSITGGIFKDNNNFYEVILSDNFDNLDKYIKLKIKVNDSIIYNNSLYLVDTIESMMNDYPPFEDLPDHSSAIFVYINEDDEMILTKSDVKLSKYGDNSDILFEDKHKYTLQDSNILDLLPIDKNFVISKYVKCRQIVDNINLYSDKIYGTNINNEKLVFEKVTTIFR